MSDRDREMLLKYLAWKERPRPDLWAAEYAWAKYKGYTK